MISESVALLSMFVFQMVEHHYYIIDIIISIDCYIKMSIGQCCIDIIQFSHVVFCISVYVIMDLH